MNKNYDIKRRIKAGRDSSFCTWSGKRIENQRLTVKKSSDTLEAEGFTITVHGKGTYVAQANRDAKLQEQQKEIEAEFEHAIEKARRYGMTEEDIRAVFDLIMEE